MESNSTTLEGLKTETLLDGRQLQYREVRGKRRYVVNNDADKQTLKDLLAEKKKVTKRKAKSQGAGAKYQRKVRRRIVVRRHFPWLQDEQIEALVAACLNEDTEYKKSPSTYLQRMALRLGYVSYCPTCKRGPIEDGAGE